MKKILITINPVVKVVLIYLSLATVWILFSDRLIYLIAAEKGLITAYQTFKGLFFVSATSVLLYVLINRMNNKLKQSRDRLQKIMDQSPAVICTVDGDGKFSQINSAAHQIWGYEREDLVNKEFLSFIHPADVALTAKRADEILKGSEVRDFENRYVRADDSNVWMKWSARWDAEE
ncbi:MAG TPA: PAS domain S-box protein, partial [Balneolaceae bacterium]|nr:PAS domain S-box protein [Balneolaceae bacterium]